MRWVKQPRKDWPSGWAPQKESVRGLPTDWVPRRDSVKASVSVPAWETPRVPATAQSRHEEPVPQ